MRENEMCSEKQIHRKEAYRKRMAYLSLHPKLLRALQGSNQLLTTVVFVLYPLLLIWLFVKQEQQLYKAIVVPLDSFILLSVFRCLVNRKRPYEVYGIPAVFNKETEGKSFPSRHVFSVTVIAMTYLFLLPVSWPGIVLLAAAGFLAAIRVVSGVHYVSDVLAGIFAGLVAGVTGYIVFP